MSKPVDQAIKALNAGRPAEARTILAGLGPEAATDALALQTWSIAMDETEAGEALALLERAVRIAPGAAQAHFNLAVRVQATGDLPRAIAHYNHALTLEPSHLGALNNLSDLYRRRGRSADAWGLLNRYRASGGLVTGLEIRLAKVAMDTGRFDEAEAWFQAAHLHAPGDHSVIFEHSMLTLAREDYIRGWPQYEARLPLKGPAGLTLYPHPQPAWDGGGKGAVLIHREQGLGDNIMFASALDGMVDEGIETHLAVAPPLARLFAESFPKAKVWTSLLNASASAPPAQPYAGLMGKIDAQAPICSLGALRMKGGPPAPRPYIRPAPADVAWWRDWLDALVPDKSVTFRVGLTLAAQQPPHKDDALTNGLRKSVPPVELAPLADIRSVSWIALHDRTSSAALADIPGLRIADPSAWITDLADTAALIANLDLVVSVDSAVAHLAAAMGKPVLLLLRRNADWRWGVDRADSPWYANVRTFRQTREGDWSDVVAAVAKALG